MPVERLTPKPERIIKPAATGGVVFERRARAIPAETTEEINQRKYLQIRENAVDDVPSLRDDTVREAVEEKLANVFGSRIKDTDTLDLLLKYRPAVSSFLDRFASEVIRERQKSKRYH